MSTQTTTITPEDLLAHSAWLQRLAARLVEPASAEDLVQETWARAVSAQPDRDRPLRPWLAEVLRNLARMRARGALRWRARSEKVRASEDVALPSPEELLTYHEAQRLVAEEVARLQEPYRSTVLLCYAQGMEPSEIARRQGIPAGTVRWRLKQGLDEVRARMDARYGNDRRAWRLLLTPLAAPALGGAARGFTVKAAALAIAVAALGVVALNAARPPVESRSGGEALRVEAREVAPARAVTRPPRLVPSGEPSGPGVVAAMAAVPGAESAAAVDPAEALKRAAAIGDSPVRGNPKAPVTIVMYSEFQCPFCSKVVPTLGELLALYPDDVRFVWKNLPLPFHESSLLSAEAAMAAGEQGKFWPMHDRLMANQDRLDPASLDEHAKAVGLDVAKFKLALDSSKFRKRVEADAQLAKDAKINGAPTFIINGEMFMGAQPLEAFKQKVEEALARAKGLPPPPRPAVVARPAVIKRALTMGPFWPPPKVVLPDALLGDRLAVPIVTGNAPTRGNPKGPVEVLYFTALGCGQCGQARLVLDGLLATYGSHVRLVAKVMPSRMEDEGPLAAEAAYAAHAAGKFWPFHDALTGGIGNPTSSDREHLDKAAEEAGLDANEFRAALGSGRYRAAALADGEAVRFARLAETAFVVNGRVADGPVALVQLVESAIKKAGQKPPAWPTGPNVLETNPAAAGYNPSMLMTVMSPRQIFAAEPRDEAWAAPIEKDLGPIIEKDLRAFDPKVTGTSLECKSSICRLRWPPGKGDPKVVRSAVNFIYALPGGPGRAMNNEHYLLLRNNVVNLEQGRTPSSAIARVKARRSSLLYNLRTGRATAPAILPVERFPKD